MAPPGFDLVVAILAISSSMMHAYPSCPLPTSNLRSAEGPLTNDFVLDFLNEHSKPVKLFWMGYHGQEEFQEDLVVGTNPSILTNRHHAWRVRSQRGILLLEIMVAHRSAVVKIQRCNVRILNPFTVASEFSGGSFTLESGTFSAKTEAKAFGDHVHVDYEFTLEEASIDRNVSAQWTRHRTCPTCAGQGGSAAHRQTCPLCGGSGVLATPTQRLGGAMAQRLHMSCGLCKGFGFMLHKGHTCQTCKGEGILSVQRVHHLYFPRGMPDDHILTVKGGGNEGAFKKPGDLIVRLHQKPHPSFTRDGDDLHTTLNLTLQEALHGFRRPIPLLGGGQHLLSRSGTTAPGHTEVFPGLGMPRFGATSGSSGGSEGAAAGGGDDSGDGGSGGGGGGGSVARGDLRVLVEVRLQHSLPVMLALGGAAGLSVGGGEGNSAHAAGEQGVGDKAGGGDNGGSTTSAADGSSGADIDAASPSAGDGSAGGAGEPSANVGSQPSPQQPQSQPPHPTDSR